MNLKASVIRQARLLVLFFILFFCFLVILPITATDAFPRVNGEIIQNISRKSVPELAHLLTKYSNLAKIIMEKLRQEVKISGSESQNLLESYKMNAARVQYILTTLKRKSQEEGPGFINIYFSQGQSGDPSRNSFEYRRVLRFLNYVTKRNRSPGQRIIIMLLGTMPELTEKGIPKKFEELAEKRVADTVRMIRRNLLNVSYEFFQGICPGGTVLYGSKDYIESGNVYLVAVYRKGQAIHKEIQYKKPEVNQTVGGISSEAKKSVNFIRKQRFRNSIGMEFVFIPPGSFIMGSPVQEFGHDLSEREHSVSFSKGFYMQTTEVTQGQWKAIMVHNPSFFLICGNDCPVENINWLDAQEFIRKLNEREKTLRYRLPTEAEWEYACRGGTKTAFANGGIITTEEDNYKNAFLNEVGWYYGNSEEATHPVARKNANAFGLYDMHGNVWEWCQDWMAKYPFKASIDPAGPSSGLSRIRRGGSWQEYPVFCRSAYRGSSHPKNKGPSVGFRVAMSLEEPFKMLNKNETSKPKVTKASVTKAFAPKRIFIRDIDFDLNSAKVSSKMKLVLDSAVRILKKQKGEILVEGFTCDIGNEKYNKGLSKRRAMAVKACLVNKGIPTLRIITRGLGEKRPKFTNKNEAGRRLNRRVEIHLITD